MTRHRSPRGRGTDPATTASTAPLARSSARHRSPGRSAVRHGAVALGITGTALAAVAPAALAPPDAPVGAALALSTQDSTLAAPTPARATGAPVTTASHGGAASADLIKASDRARAASLAAATAAATSTARPTAGSATGSGALPAAARGTTPAEAGADLDCGASSTYGGVKASVRTVGHALECVFPGHDMLGVGSRGGTSDHPGGYALDMMTTDGDAIAACVVDHADALGVSYVIWDQRINTGSGWKGMADRGGATANHEDHVHISFRHGGDPDVSVLRRCG